MVLSVFFCVEDEDLMYPKGTLGEVVNLDGSSEWGMGESYPEIVETPRGMREGYVDVLQVGNELVVGRRGCLNGRLTIPKHHQMV
jgi:hypothetical protein